MGLLCSDEAPLLGLVPSNADARHAVTAPSSPRRDPAARATDPCQVLDTSDEGGPYAAGEDAGTEQRVEADAFVGFGDGRQAKRGPLGSGRPPLALPSVKPHRYAVTKLLIGVVAAINIKSRMFA